MSRKRTPRERADALEVEVSVIAQTLGFARAELLGYPPQRSFDVWFHTQVPGVQGDRYFQFHGSLASIIAWTSGAQRAILLERQRATSPHA